MAASTARHVRTRLVARRTCLGMLIAAGFEWSNLFAQAVPEAAAGPAVPPATTGADASCHCLPAGAVIELRLTEAIHSAHRKSGEAFAFEVHAAAALEGIEVIPAGTPGVGEVVHADRSRSGGKPGELLLAARHLQLGERRIALRGLKLGGAGADKAGAALAASFVIGPFALFMRGKEIEIPAGTVVEAKLAEAVALPVPVPPASDTTPTTEE